jgi:putative transcriptional regulator
LNVADKSKRKRGEEIGEESLAGIRQIQAYNRGELPPGAVRVRKTIPVAPPAEIRARMGLSQYEFAAILGVSVRTLQEWEQGRRRPRSPAKALLRVADQQPGVFSKLQYTRLVEDATQAAPQAVQEPVAALD